MKTKNVKERARRIRLLLLDVDGVLTDGRIIYSDSGEEIKCFDVQDGFGLVVFDRLGGRTAWITARGSKSLERRAKEMRAHALYQHALNKVEAYDKAKIKFGVRDFEVCYVGDELIDLPVMKRVGLSVAVQNARPEVRRLAHMITRARGGQGAVREVVEFILKSQGKWKGIVRRYT